MLLKTRSLCTFQKPNRMPSYDSPKTKFELNARSFKEINNIIYNLKTANTYCPLDQISIITLTCSPYLKTNFLEIIKSAWPNKVTPEEWKKAITILIHKKEPTEDPQNFRPITLQCVFLKVYTSFIRHRTFKFLKDNTFVLSLKNTIQIPLCIFLTCISSWTHLSFIQISCSIIATFVPLCRALFGNHDMPLSSSIFFLSKYGTILLACHFSSSVITVDL